MSFLNRSFLSIAVSAALVSSAMAKDVVTNTSYEDIADAAVWADSRGDKSLLIASLEGDGIAVYDQNGIEIQHISNVEAVGADVRYGVRSNNRSFDLVAVALPEDKAFGFYRIDADKKQPLTDIGQFSIDIAPEGLCLYQNPTTRDISVAGYNDAGQLLQYKLLFNGKAVSSRLQNEYGKAIAVRHTQVGGKLSGCVADDKSGTLYVAEQNIGIWKYGADAENVKDRALVDVALPLGNIEEIENIDLVQQKDGKGYLIIADEGQGFMLYDRTTGEYISRFNIEGIAEAKLVTVAPGGLWVGNTEADEPVYQYLSAKKLSELTDIEFDKFETSYESSSPGLALIPSVAETKQVDDDGDAADDPSLWFNVAAPEKSLIIATNKQGGLLAYTLSGEEVQYLKQGEPNNVDIRQDIRDWDGRDISIAAVTNRELNTLALYSIDATDTPIKPLKVIGNNVHSEASELVSSVDEVYGLCMSKGKDGTPYVFLNGKGGIVEQWKLTLTKSGIKGDIVRKLRVESQPEGCVVDDETQVLYLGEEDKAIWMFDAEVSGSDKAKLFASVDDKSLHDDIEGLTIYQNSESKYLLASSQGNNTYAMYDLKKDNKYLGSFAVVGNDDAGVDGTSDTDGIHASAYNLGDAYPQGIFIAQDWYNIDENYQVENQNFKLVDWRDIAAQVVK